jgi:DNA-binding MarR family transcriptional regulator
MKKLELLQQEKLGIGYIKSYPILKQLPITPIQIEILQLVLSYQSNNQDFHMGYDKIAQILSSTTNSITKNISILNKNNYIQTNHTSNYNGKDGVVVLQSK